MLRFSKFLKLSDGEIQLSNFDIESILLYSLCKAALVDICGSEGDEMVFDISLNNFVTSAPIFRILQAIQCGDISLQILYRNYSTLLTLQSFTGGYTGRRARG